MTRGGPSNRDGVAWGGPGHGLEDEFRGMLAQVDRECPPGTGRPIAAARLLSRGRGDGELPHGYVRSVAQERDGG